MIWVGFPDGQLDLRTERKDGPEMFPHADTTRSKTRWLVLGSSVRGALHARAGFPNQDALGWLPEAGEGPPIVSAIADGHGSGKSFRSETGARIAVDIAVQVLMDFVSSWREGLNLSLIKRTAEDHVPRTLTWRWRQTVEEHLRQNPFLTEELDRIVSKEGQAAGQAIEETPQLAYGSTLLAVAVTESYILYVQLGDGDILAVTADGVVRSPLPYDDRLIADETTSLCSLRAENEFRVGFQPITDHSPAVILASTDGYSKSYVDLEGFRRVGPDILSMIRSRGLTQVRADLEDWLVQMSQRGAGTISLSRSTTERRRQTKCLASVERCSSVLGP